MANFNYTATTDSRGNTSYDNPLVQYLGGPMGAYQAQVGQQNNQRDQQENARWTAQQQQQAQQRLDRMPWRGRGLNAPAAGGGIFSQIFDSLGLGGGTQGGAAGGAGGGTAPGGGLQPNVNVTQGPVWSPEHVAGSVNAMRGSTAALPQQAGQPSDVLGDYLDDLMRGDMGRRATDFNQQATYANSQQELNAGQSANQLGVQRGRGDAAQYATQTGMQTGVFAMIMDMLASLGGG